MSKTYSMWRNRRGATAVEFALIAPIFLIMVLGIAELGRLLWIKSSMQYAVDESARYVMVNTSTTTSALETYAATTIPGQFLSGIIFTATSDTYTTPNTMTLTASYNFSSVVGQILGYTLVPDVALSATSKTPLNN